MKKRKEAKKQRTGSSKALAGSARPWYLYLLGCADDTTYTGITTDIERRLSEHEDNLNKGAKYLRGKGPLTVVWQAAAGNRSEASRMESRIKRLPRQAKQQLVDGSEHVRQQLGLG